MGIVATAVAVASTFLLGTPYKISSLAALEAMGVTAANNPSFYKIMREFFAQAGDGTDVFIMGLPDTAKLSDMVDITNATGAKKLVDFAEGKLRGLAISRTPDVGYTPTITEGLDADVILARQKGNEFAETYTTSKFAPLFVIIEGAAFSGVAADLKDLTTEAYNRVSVMIGDTVNTSTNAAIGILAGRIASIPVQRNIGRVKDGPLYPITAFIGSTPVSLADVAAIDDKGYITFRTFINQSGFYFNDDFTATKPTDDYSHLTARRTIDKAYRIAYQALLQNLLDEVPVNEDGTLQTAIVKGWQSNVEQDIALQMTANGELSGDITKGDNGVKCYINENQNLVATSNMVVQLRVRPFGYPRYIDLYLGFTILGA